MKRYRWSLLLSSLALMAVCLLAAPSLAAEKITVRYGFFELSLPVVDLQQYAETNTVSPALGGFLRFASREQQQELRALLQVNLPVDLVAIDRVLNGAIGVTFLQQLSTAIVGGDRAGVQALRAAAVLGIKAQELSILSFLEAYPDQQLKLDLPNTLRVIDASSAKPPTDTLPEISLWQTLVAYQAAISENKRYPVCLFGDSISAPLVNRLGVGTANFALSGMSSVSLMEQLKQLVAKHVTCQNVLLAIGTNDAWYTITDDRVRQNLKEAIGLARQLSATKVVMFPAFYSTLAASKKPALAGSIDRVEAINQVIEQAATAMQVPVETSALQPLFDGKTLKGSLTTDGVHLNGAGLEVYRQSILNVIRTLSQSGGYPAQQQTLDGDESSLNPKT